MLPDTPLLFGFECQAKELCLFSSQSVFKGLHMSNIIIKLAKYVTFKIHKRKNIQEKA